MTRTRKTLLLGLLASTPLLMAPGYYYGVPVIGQQNSNWCWAASSEMLVQFFRPGVDARQCDMANARFGRTDCCDSPTPDSCNQGGFFTMVPGQAGGSYGLTGQYGMLTREQMMAQIDAGKPMGAALYWSGGGGHAVVVNGYFDYISRDYYVYVQDPWPPNQGTGNRWVKWEHFVADTVYEDGYAPHTLGGFVHDIGPAE